MPEQEAVTIPYLEYRAINALLHAHLNTHQKQLRALVAFGPLVTRGNTFDINLLEVVDGWSGPNFVTFASSAELPLRGLLRLNVFSTNDLQKLSKLRTVNIRRTVDDVLEQLQLHDILGQFQQGYEVIYEEPAGFISKVLTQDSEATQNINPLTFLDAAAREKEAV